MKNFRSKLTYADVTATLALPVGIALALAALALLAGTAQAQTATGKRAAAEACGTVVVQFKPEGSGGANEIQAIRIDCERARNIVGSCVKGEVVQGWSVVVWGGKTLMAKDRERIRYTGVGGGGCGHLPETCGDFGYRGVGFFGVRVVGLKCEEGRATAKRWYDHGGECFFGSTCELDPFRCRANAKTGTVTCIKPNGFRVRWQMGE